MTPDSKNIKKEKKIISTGLCGKFDCPVCIFTKSQAPGNPYNLNDCPKYTEENNLDPECLN